jgi:hypothetical protein
MNGPSKSAAIPQSFRLENTMENTQPGLHSLAVRLELLEAQNRRWKCASVILGLVTASLLLTAAKPTENMDPSVVRAHVVEAQDFLLQGTDGQVHARLHMSGSHSPSLQFYDEKGDIIWSANQSPIMVPTKYAGQGARTWK